MTKETLSILIADDEYGDRKQLQRVFKQLVLPCETQEAEDMDEVVSFCNEKNFDFIFLDYQMPGNDRLEGVPLLRGLYPYTSIILMTGQGDEKVASQAIKSGAMDYVPKRLITPDSIQRIIAYARERIALQKKLDEQRISLERFSHTLVHDLRAPIRHISWFSEVMAESVAKKDYQDLADYCDRIGKAALRMQDLISTLSLYNSIDTSNVPFKEESMKHIVEEAIAVLSQIIKEKRASVTFDDLPVVFCNVPQIIQLMQNLIGNAIKYCDEPVPQVYITSQKVGEWHHVCVADNGIGIEERFHNTIFNPFNRLHGSESEQFSGSGLGLSTCKKIMDRHQGEIWCESALGRGSKFYFTLRVSAPS